MLFVNLFGCGLLLFIVNVVWGVVNFVIVYVFVCWVGDFDLKCMVDVVVFGFGILVFGLFFVWCFGVLYGGNELDWEWL